MIFKEGEHGFIEVPQISKKTSTEQLARWAKEYWPRDSRQYVAGDIINNGKELIKWSKSDCDWEFVLRKIRTRQVGNLYIGKNAIAMRNAQLIGALAMFGEWRMDDPPLVYLSGQLLGDMAKGSGELEDFEKVMRQTTREYGQKVFSHAPLYMGSLDFSLRVENRDKHRNTINRVVKSLASGRIEEAYNIVNSCGALVRTHKE